MGQGTARRDRGGRWFTVLRRLLDLLDIPVIYGALAVSYQIRFHCSLFPSPSQVPPFEVYQATFLVLSVLWFLIFAVSGLYRHRVRFGVGHVGHIVRTVMLATAAVLVGVFFYRDFSYSRLTVVIAVVVTTSAICLFHLFKLMLLLVLHARGVGLRRVVVAGGGELAADCWMRLRIEAVALGYELVGVCADEPVPAVDGSVPPPVLGTLAELPGIVEREGVEDVFIAMPPGASDRALEVMRTVEPLGVHIKIVPNIFSIITSSVAIQDVAGMPCLVLGPLPIHGWGGVVKGAFDRVVAGVGLVLVSPLLALVALRIKFDSPGPVIYAQDRVGLDGTVFTIYKFRSMRVDAEVATGPVWATQGDPRRTRFGEFIRKYSIDELPQLWNVLRGDMSLVGPRPERPFFVERFRNHVPHYMSRHVVKAGITGWAQVNGLRGQSPIEERTRFDTWYIENWSLGLDLMILLRTVYVCVFRPTGF